jgi:hypothetical protein
LIKITIEAQEIVEEVIMANEGSRKVTIDVPMEKYALLEEIKNMGEINSIRAGVTEGVDLVILAHRDLLEKNIKSLKEDINVKVDNLQDTLSKIEKEHK